MYKLATRTSALAGCMAVLLISFPNLRQYLPSPWLSGFVDKKEDLAVSHPQNYSTVTVSTDPLLVYISDFLSDSEIDHILGVTETLFVPSRVYNPGSPSHRNSSSCVLPSSDLLHEVIIDRSKAFLDTVIKENPAAGVSYFDIEPLQLVSYGPMEYYNVHVDWFEALHRENKGWRSRLYNRVASFFIYLDDNCVGGETHFPKVSASAIESESVVPEPWLNLNGSGTSFIPKKGTGIFWVNLLPDGIGDDRLIHAGLPVEQGRKVGMNIWVKRDFGW